MSLTPPFGIVMWYTLVHLNGSIGAFYSLLKLNGVLNTLYSIWPTPYDPYTWKLILGFMAFELALMRIVPGEKFLGPVTATGNVPVYKSNGFRCFIISGIELNTNK